MTNFEKLLERQLKDPDFARAYRESRIERLVEEMLDALKERIARNEPKENLLRTIAAMRRRFHRRAA